ncbi:hypothetical protein [Paenibacillus nasutitermitis]|uniref:Uncharacterized protein n=1 Tax=Paenibacillus nasutitermitis TaxID=1652958 RepID=A0A917DQ90_9BACL|nr:hypothetical protein [Paenibacillus nasutitermitis]GGD56334.1 hypothetical protein GCM10010911_12570 [Paenibacillus nasutitermitis]
MPRKFTTAREKLYEIADIVLDNCGCDGDAAVYLERIGLPVGPTSTVIGAFMLNRVVVQISENYGRRNLVPQVFISANTVKGDKHNTKLLKNFQ